MKFKPKRNLFLATCIMLASFLYSCKQNKAVRNIDYVGAADTIQVSKLISTGKRLQNADIDSLPIIAKQLNQIYQSAGDKKAFIYAQLFNAHYYWQSADHKQAMQVAFKALNDAERMGVKQPLPEIFNLIGNLHKENTNYPMAFKAAQDGLDAAKLNKDTASIISLLGLKAMFIHSYHLKKGTRNDDHESMPLQFEALKIAEANPKYERLSIRFYNNIAQTYKERREFDKAVVYASKAVALANKYNQQRSLTYSYCWLGETYYFMGDLEKGIDYLKKALVITRDINQPYRQMEVYESMYDCYRSSGHYKEALVCIRRFTSIRDSLQVLKNVKQISELQLKYETAKKDNQIIVLNQTGKTKSRELLWISVGTIVIIILFVLLLFQYYTIKNNHYLITKNNNKLNDAMQKIAFIQSHEIRKPLASIMGLMNVIREEDYHAGKDYLLKLEALTNELDQKIRNIVNHTE